MKTKLILPLLVTLLTLFACQTPVASPTAGPATNTPLPPTDTPVPAPAYQIGAVDMIDETNGWAWEALPDGSTPLLRTADGGQTWSEVSPADVAINSYGAFFLDAQTAWVPYFDPNVGAGGLMHTTDGGQSWRQIETQPFGLGFFHFTSASDGWAEYGDVGAGNLYLTYYETHDGGQSWVPIPIKSPFGDEGLPAGTLHLCSMCSDMAYYDPQRVMLAFGNMNFEANFGVVNAQISTDLGQTWRNVTLTLPAGYEMAYYAPMSVRFFAGGSGVLPVSMLTTVDGVDVTRLAFFTTVDGGATWAFGAMPDFTFAAYYAPQMSWGSARDGFMRCGSGFCVTHDGAQTWQVITPNIVLEGQDASGQPVDLILNFDFVSSTTGFAVLVDSATRNVYTLHKTTDGGQTWSVLP